MYKVCQACFCINHNSSKNTCQFEKTDLDFRRLQIEICACVGLLVNFDIQCTCTLYTVRKIMSINLEKYGSDQVLRGSYRERSFQACTCRTWFDSYHDFCDLHQFMDCAGQKTPLKIVVLSCIDCSQLLKFETIVQHCNYHV